MSRQASAQEQPPLDTLLQTKLVSRFGTKILRQGFTAVPVAIQRLYRYVPGECLDGEIQFMTPTEFVFMLDVWSYWWSNGAKPWPSIKELASHLGKCTRQVKRYITTLEDKGFLLVEERYTEEGRQTTNCYNFTPFLQRFLQMLEEMEQLARPLHVVGEGDISDTGRVTFESQGRVTFESPEVYEEEENKLEAEVSRSDSVASDNLSENKIEKRNVQHPEEKEKSGAARSENVYSLEKARRSRRKKHARGAIPPQLPDYLKESLQPFCLHFCDQSRAASATSLAWMYADVQRRGMDETTFAFLMDSASHITIEATAAGRIEGRNRDGSVAQMPYFLSVLEMAVDDWCKRFDEKALRQEDGVLLAHDKVIETEEQEEMEQHLEEVAPSSIQESVSLPAHDDLEESGEDDGQTESVMEVGKDRQEAATKQIFIETDDSEAGWSSANAKWHGDQLRHLLGKESYDFEVRATRSGRWGFVIWECGQKREGVWEFSTNDAVKECRQALVRENTSKLRQGQGI